MNDISSGQTKPLIGHWEVMADTGELFWSDEIYAIHGLEVGGEIDIDAAIDAYHPDDRELVAEYVRRALEEKESYQFELRIVHSGGAIRNVRATGAVKLHSNGEVCSIFGVFQDITEALLNEQRLAERTEFLLQAERLANIGHWVVYSKSGELFWSDEIYRIHGQKVGADIDVNAAIDAYHPNDRDKVREYVRLALEERQDYQFELRIVRPDGEVRYVRSSGTVRLDAQGDVDSLFGIFQDVTERTVIAKELERQRTLFEAVFRESVDAILITDNERNILMTNPALTRIYGYTEEEIVGRKPDFFYADPEEFERQGNIRYGKDSREMHEPYEVRYKRKNGEELISETVGTQFREPDGEVMGFIAVSRDVTDRKNSEKALIAAKEKAEYANRAKSEFLANMSHELRTPLNAVIGFSQLMLEEILGTIQPDKYRQYLGLINQSGNHLLEMISDILDIAKVESGEVSLDIEEINVAETVTSCVELVRGRSKIANVSLSVDISDQITSLCADQRRIKQILINLLANAIKFTPEGGNVHVTADPALNGGVVFRIADTGIGIPANKLLTIMDPFTQAHQDNLISGVQGTGLGLSIVKSTVELHGGQISLNSEEGVGTTVTVEIPNREI